MTQTTKDAVLTEFLNNPGRYISGDFIAGELGLSRESIWKAIQQLRREGHEIVSKKKSGYCYLRTAKLNAAVIEKYLPEQDVCRTIVFDQIDSTQIYAKDYISQHKIEEPLAVVTASQTAGYGRRGRHFYSPEGNGLYISLILPVQESRIEAGLLTTSAAAAIVGVLESFFPDKEFQLKWVNDFLLKQHKIGGIITEAVMDLESQTYSALILGFALNIQPSNFPEEISQKAGTILDERDESLDYNLLTAYLLDALIEMYEHYQDGRYMAFYRQHSALIGQQVTVQIGTELVEGTVTGIDDQGALLLKTTAGDDRTVYSGEVTKVKLMSNLNL
ncbi:biotin--[acetyl-CoA-carboxylase] ligase [Eupransor demetentiae]|uniref:Bifunctional ligase/repressor BirA n=1 Tax=Eupransor demetentiae TaxID=3109584 RepID=A0ABM9N3P0_9LACO|nr:Biotin operon repressor (BirA) [Lactobacillaceae bacterium LMG 33000]